MLRTFRADLHVHTCLSPCAELSMTPRGIAAAAVDRGLDLVAICDHNSAENVEAVIEAGRGVPLMIVPGMEVTSREEVHLLAWFAEPTEALRLQEVVYAHLPGVNDPEAFGLQVVANAEDEVLAINERLLIGATELSVDELVELIHHLGGLVCASHVDRESFSLVGQLGGIPPELELDAVEVSSGTGIAAARERFDLPPHLPVLRSSDAHAPAEIGLAPALLRLEQPTFAELAMALRRAEGRQVIEEEN